jgi:hypothetical protein
LLHLLGSEEIALRREDILEPKGLQHRLVSLDVSEAQFFIIAEVRIVCFRHISNTRGRGRCGGRERSKFPFVVIISKIPSVVIISKRNVVVAKFLLSGYKVFCKRKEGKEVRR